MIENMVEITIFARIYIETGWEEPNLFLSRLNIINLSY